MKASELGEIGRILVVGMARSGIAAARAAKRLLPAVEVIIADSDPEPTAAGERDELRENNVQVELGRQDHTLLDGCGLVIKSPGVPPDISLLKEAHQRGIPVWGEVEFAWQFLDNLMIGVTGTNGKTTTTQLIGHIIKQAGWPCRVAGNIGNAVSELVGNVDDNEILVVELSSFQLEDSIEFRPDIGVLLNLAEDHLDRYDDMDRYISSKLMIFSNQQYDDLAVLNLDDAALRERVIPGRAGHVWFTTAGAGSGPHGSDRQPIVYMKGDDIVGDHAAMVTMAAGIRCRHTFYAASEQSGGGRNGPAGGEDSEKVFSWSEASLKGRHNLENCLAATSVCLGLGLAAGDIAAGLRSFPGVPHRLQEVRTSRGVTYVNDSKATNVDAAVMALTAYENGVHMILGGSLKGCSFDRLAEAAAGENVREIIVIGEAAAEIGASFEKVGRDVVRAGDLEAAVRMASSNASPGEVVLLSPACASFDQYQNFEERGEHFITLVEAIGD